MAAAAAAEWFEPSNCFSDETASPRNGKAKANAPHSNGQQATGTTASPTSTNGASTSSANATMTILPAKRSTTNTNSGDGDASPLMVLPLPSPEAPHPGAAAMMPGTTPPQITRPSSMTGMIAMTTGMGIPAVHPSYFHPVHHQVQCAYRPDDYFGHIFTQGMHAQGFPELFASGVPRHRTALVVKNMRFLASRMIGGIPVLSGHRSTDADYRVKISEILEEGYRHNVLLHYVGTEWSRLKDARVFELSTYYPDAEDWGGFPPAPEAQRERRNRLLNTIFFPSFRDGSGTTVNQEDVAYMARHLSHFCRILGFQGHPQNLVGNLPMSDLKYKLQSHMMTMSLPSVSFNLLEAHLSEEAEKQRNAAAGTTDITNNTALIKIQPQMPDAAAAAVSSTKTLAKKKTTCADRAAGVLSKTLAKKKPPPTDGAAATTTATKTLPKKKAQTHKTKSRFALLGARNLAVNGRDGKGNKKLLAATTDKENAANHDTSTAGGTQRNDKNDHHSSGKQFLRKTAPAPVEVAPLPKPVSSSAIAAILASARAANHKKQRPPVAITEWVSPPSLLPSTPITLSKTKTRPSMDCTTNNMDLDASVAQKHNGDDGPQHSSRSLFMDVETTPTTSNKTSCTSGSSTSTCWEI